MPRTSSAISILFCGMMLEPVEKASSSSMNLNSHEHQRTISSEKRKGEPLQLRYLRLVPCSSRGRKRRQGCCWSRARNPEARPKARGLRDRSFRPMHRTRAGTRPYALRIRKTGQIALEHLCISQQVMPEGNGLSALHMGVARHDRFFEDRVPYGTAQRLNPRFGHKAHHTVFHKYNLTSTATWSFLAACGVKSLPSRAQTRGEFTLHKRVDILGIKVNLEFSALDII